jgi:hypothetical protein
MNISITSLKHLKKLKKNKPFNTNTLIAFPYNSTINDGLYIKYPPRKVFEYSIQGTIK